jgi:Zn-finger nucleic acid-binding protein
MQCPIDQTTLSMTERQGIEIDYCPKCRGVWLDRGELDKLIESGSPTATQNTAAPSPPRETYSEPRHDDRRYDSDDRHEYKKKHKKEGFLKDLFDF